MNGAVRVLAIQNPEKKVRLLFQDEAGFGRINKPKNCWCTKGIRPSVPCHHIREYRYVYGAVDPMDGERELLSCHAILQYRMHAGIPESAAVNVPG